MERKLNICIISREFAPDTAFGGMATFSLETAVMLKERGHDVIVLSQSMTKDYSTTIKGIEIRKFKIPRKTWFMRGLPALIFGFNYRVCREIIRLNKIKAFDLIDAPDHLAEGLFATLFTRIPVVTRLHTPFSIIVELGLNNYKKSFKTTLIRIAEKIALQRSAAIYSPCLDMYNRVNKFFSIGHVPFHIYGYPFDLNLFSPKPDQVKKQKNRILFLGRLEQRKGIETIAEAFPAVKKLLLEATLTIVGADTANIKGYASAKVFLQEVFDHHGVGGSVSFRNHVLLDELPEIFHNHDIIWVPSLYDNFPLICLEAMACGKTVIASRVGGLPEMVINEKSGLLFEAGNAKNLVEQTLRVSQSPELSELLETGARNFVVENCSPEKIYEQTCILYEMALKK